MVTPPLNGLILPGITRRSIITLGREWGQFKVTERVITMEEIRNLLSENRVRLKEKISFLFFLFKEIEEKKKNKKKKLP